MYCNYQGTWKSGCAFMNSWLIKVHENQVMKYESNICTAIIKVHENQVMQNLDHDGKWHNFATLTNCTANSWIHDLSRYMKISWCFHEFCTAIIKVHENQVMQKILWEFSIFKVSELFTLLKSADCLHC